jgi:hypothetical protein
MIGRTPKPKSRESNAKAQRNFTDPGSRVRLSKDGFIQGYNAQAAVDGKAQVIAVHELAHRMSDQVQLILLGDSIEKSLGRKPGEAPQAIAAH